MPYPKFYDKYFAVYKGGPRDGIWEYVERPDGIKKFPKLELSVDPSLDNDPSQSMTFDVIKYELKIQHGRFLYYEYIDKGE